MKNGVVFLQLALFLPFCADTQGTLPRNPRSGKIKNLADERN